jgi:rhamnosyl/mannosyltransferase
MTRFTTSIYERTFGRFVLRSSLRVIAVSQATAAHVGRLGARNVTVVANGVDHGQFVPPPQRPESPIEIVFVGRLIGNKGPAMALAAFSSLHHPAARLTFVGDGPSRADLEKAGAKIGDAVRFLGHRDDVAEVLKAAHIMVRPSQTEGQSLAMLEAMASGMVIVASDIEANRELIQTGVTGLLHRTNNVIDLADALHKAITDPVFRQSLAAAAHQQSLRYSWDQCATQTGVILLAAANEKGGR